MFNTFFRFLSKHATCRPERIASCGSDVAYRWDKLSFYTQWRPSKSSVLLCFDIPGTVRDQIRQELLGTNKKISAEIPFGLHSFLIPFVVRNFDEAVWSCRDLIRGLEYNRPDVLSPKVDYIRMHEIARHSIHSTEMLGTAITVLDSMLLEIHRLGASAPQALTIERDFNFHRSTLRCLQLRSQALEERLRNEINLVSNEPRR